MDDLIRRSDLSPRRLHQGPPRAAAACHLHFGERNVDTRDGRSGYPADEPVTDEYRQEEITGGRDFFGVTAPQGAAEVVERVFGDPGRPNAPAIAGRKPALTWWRSACATAKAGSSPQPGPVARLLDRPFGRLRRRGQRLRYAGLLVSTIG